MTSETNDRGASATTPNGGPRRVSRRVVAAAAAVTVAILVIAAVVVWLVNRGDSVGPVPYADPASAGQLTLCVDGSPVTQGKTTDLPFATAVVGSQQAVGGYAQAGRTATLYAFQPRPGVEPEEWSGLQLSGTVGYADPAAPTATLAANATTLGQFLSAYPALQNGWLQLRLVLGAPGVTAQTEAYATADLHVHGDAWTLADPGSASCPTH